MATTIAPTAGQGLVYTQGGAGTAPGYSAIDDRRAGAAIQEGVLAGFVVQQRGAGANMSVDIDLTGSSGYVTGDTIAQQGNYYIGPHFTALINEVVTAADVSNPRIDQVILEVLDSTHDGSGLNLARIRVLAGTPTVGATLSNRTGAAALPGSAIRLADVLVGTGVTSIGNTVIRDRRQWAQGAYATKQIASGSYSITAGNTSIDATNLGFRLECSGAPMEFTLTATIVASGGAGFGGVRVFQDGSAFGASYVRSKFQAAADEVQFCHRFVGTPAAGSHTFDPGWQNDTGAPLVMNLAPSASQAVVFTAEEILRGSHANNTVTSG